MIVLSLSVYAFRFAFVHFILFTEGQYVSQSLSSAFLFSVMCCVFFSELCFLCFTYHFSSQMLSRLPLFHYIHRNKANKHYMIRGQQRHRDMCEWVYSVIWIDGCCRRCRNSGAQNRRLLMLWWQCEWKHKQATPQFKFCSVFSCFVLLSVSFERRETLIIGRREWWWRINLSRVTSQLQSVFYETIATIAAPMLGNFWLERGWHAARLHSRKERQTNSAMWQISSKT